MLEDLSGQVCVKLFNVLLQIHLLEQSQYLLVESNVQELQVRPQFELCLLLSN